MDKQRSRLYTPATAGITLATVQPPELVDGTGGLRQAQPTDSEWLFILKIMRGIILGVILWISFSVWFFPPPHTTPAQASQNIPVTITKTNNGLLIEWELPTNIGTETEAIALLKEAGWADDLLDHIHLPAYTIGTFESPVSADDLKIPSAEIVAAVDVLERELWTQPIERREMPDLVGPSGKQLPFVSPLASPEVLAPTEPVFILREGFQRGQRIFTIAFSPIYSDEGTIYLATKGAATLVGLEMGRVKANIPNPSLLPNAGKNTEQNQETQMSSSNQSANIALNQSPLATPNVRDESPIELAITPATAPATAPVTEQPANKNLPLELPLGRPTTVSEKAAPPRAPLTSPLALPLGQPTIAPQRAPLTSPLALPLAIPLTLPQAIPTEEPAEVPSPINDQAETIAPTQTSSADLAPADTGPLDVTPADAVTTEESNLDVSAVDTSSPKRTPITPWTGLLTFALFGIALIVALFSRGE